MPRITDAYGRPLTNLRLVVTDECNYRCIFCHMEGEPIDGPRRPGTGSPLLRPGDYRIISLAARLLGVGKFKLTGGEPLLRADIVEIVRAIRSGAPSSEVSITTNGFFLHSLATSLADAGVKRVNISIHSLNPGKYKFITGVPGLDRALRGLDAARDAGIKVKINMVVLRGINDSEILDMARFAHSKGAVLQLIELHPVGLGAKFFNKYFYSLSKIEKLLINLGARRRIRSLHNRPIYTLPTGETIEIVRPYDNPLFCAGCTRIRIGPYGDVLPCLNWRGPRPLLSPVLRSGMPEDEKVVRIAEILTDVVISRKPFFLCTLEKCRIPVKPRAGRIALPKARLGEDVKQELRRLLVRVGAPQSRGRG